MLKRQSIQVDPSVEPAPARKQTILIAEPRDEVFARLAYDLSALPVAIVRAVRGGDVVRMYRYSHCRLAICHHRLLDASVWLAATKLRLFDVRARIWLYSTGHDPHEQRWAELAGIERVVRYKGDIWQLASELRRQIHLDLCRPSPIPSARKGLVTTRSPWL